MKIKNPGKCSCCNPPKEVSQEEWQRKEVHPNVLGSVIVTLKGHERHWVDLK